MLKEPKVDSIWRILESVKDPEIPVLSVVDLGVVRDILFREDSLEVVITPTYSGCPAMNTIEEDIKNTLVREGYGEAKVRTVLFPPWTTDWMSEKGKEKLEAFGIAPPVGSSNDPRTLSGKDPRVKCPHCKSLNTILVSQFGSTACKAHYKCNDCLEPFDYFKCLILFPQIQ